MQDAFGRFETMEAASRIQKHAAARGESTNAFIYRAINETIERDSEE